MTGNIIGGDAAAQKARVVSDGDSRPQPTGRVRVVDDVHPRPQRTVREVHKNVGRGPSPSEGVAEMVNKAMETMTAAMTKTVTAAMTQQTTAMAQMAQNMAKLTSTDDRRSKEPKRDPGTPKKGEVKKTRQRQRRQLSSSEDERSDGPEPKRGPTTPKKGNGKKTQRRPVRQPFSSDDDSSDDQSEGEFDFLQDPSPRRTRSARWNPRLPVFTGKEPWRVWFNRFKSVAKRRKWSEDECLDELLPKLEGTAGVFVFEQLPEAVINDFKKLVRELDNRFRKVESSRTFAAQFAHRTQKASETIEEYAAELKRLYDKAHSNRDSETRKHDLLRKFLDGLSDPSARFEIEYFKEPGDIDEAVAYAVEYAETKSRIEGKFNGDEGRKQRKLKVARVDQRPEDDASSEEERVAKVKDQAVKRDVSETSKALDEVKSMLAKLMDKSESIEKDNQELRQSVEKDTQELRRKLEDLSVQREVPRPRYPPPPNGNRGNVKSQSGRPQMSGPAPPLPPRPVMPPPVPPRDYSKYTCWECGEVGHLRWNCPKKDGAAQGGARSVPKGYIDSRVSGSGNQATPRSQGPLN